MCLFLVQKQEGNINDCGVSKQKCHLKASCVKEQGSEQCRCDDGYEGDGVQCERMCIWFIYVFVDTSEKFKMQCFFV